MRPARRISRRAFLRGAAAAGVGGALVVAGCADPRGKGRATPTAAPSPSPVPASVTRGGILRIYSYDALIADSLDPHLTRGGPIANVHSAVFSRLLRYADPTAGDITSDLAADMPEQPDELTYIVRLRGGVRFHDTPASRLAYPAAAGRKLGPSDVQHSLERQASPAQPFQRRSQFAVIDRVKAAGADAVTITLKRPVAPFLSIMAGRHAFIIPREVALSDANNAAALTGTGPFVLDAWEPGVAVRIRRNADWFAAGDGGEGAFRPFIDGVDAHLSPESDPLQRAALERKLIDATEFTETATVEHVIATTLEDVALEEREPGGMLSLRLLTDRPPFSDSRARRAVHLAIDRTQLGDLLYPSLHGEPSYRLSGPVPPAIERWAIDPADLAALPGYRSERELRDRDRAEARQLWAAAASQTPVFGIAMLVAGTPVVIARKAAPAIQRMLRETLGVETVVTVDPSGDAVVAAALRRNAAGATEGTAMCTLAFEDGGIDIDDCVYQFRSGEPANSYRLQDAALDAQIDAQRAEFDPDARLRKALGIQEYLLANVNARLDLVAPIRRRLRWGYVRHAALSVWHGHEESLADVWLDHGHEAWAARPA